MSAKMVLDWNEYTDTARQVAAEGCVLLKNEENVLPLAKGSKAAVFGRIQRHYYKSGTGSGGMVNVSKVIGILDALLEEKDVTVDPELLAVYDKWEEENPFDEGLGWAAEPWSQAEMPVTEELIRECSARNDIALIIIGRTAGEDRDNVDEKGAYRLSDIEADLIEKVTSGFGKVIVLFNTGGIMDMSHPSLSKCQALLYCWQGGMIGGYGVADVLTGRVNPSGHLADTIAAGIEDYPSTENFGDEVRNFYKEDIYVGYRYFETAAKEKVLFPFGYGLSYTDFTERVVDFRAEGGEIMLSTMVENTGTRAGKQVVQIYVEAPQGKLGKASRVLAGFAKTGEIKPGETERLKFNISSYQYASYDDSGVTGNPYCYVLEVGKYTVYVGKNVCDAVPAGSYELKELVIVKKYAQQMAPVLPFERMRPRLNADGSVFMDSEPVPTGRERDAEKRKENLPKELSYTGDRGYKLKDAAEQKITMEQFVMQFDDDDLSCIIRGEGMGSPKVTPGTAAAYGGVSKHLQQMGIPCGCCSDGPSGMRIDCGLKAFSLPNGTLMACTFNLPLIEELYSFTGREMISNKIDNLLGPGMNIHRHPLNGRNFEYFSEDPYLTGKMAAAQIRGLRRAGVTGTIKHFAGNNQETKRTETDSVISERALREIYLKGFEIAVREGGADSIMTTYGALNGVWTAGRYELNTSILREEWGFTGIVMTDWWAKISSQGQSGEAKGNDFAAMAKAQNDLYMVCPDGSKNCTSDNTLEELAACRLTRGELQRNAINICRQLISTPAYLRSIGEEIIVDVVNRPQEAEDFQLEDIVYFDVSENTTIPLADVDPSKDSNYVFALSIGNQGIYEMEIVFRSELEAMAQIPVTVFTQSVPIGVITFNGTGGQWSQITKRVCMATKYVVVRLHFAQSGAELKEMKFRLVEKVKDEGVPLDVEGEYDMGFR
ncbi:MAG: glycoside hydrolase family 3 C-terminal domain-containing protein [Roseburia sp.]|nr:glycoside hydrolase family 3 C-terminal domain-containing protein [Roseburia sp.]